MPTQEKTNNIFYKFKKIFKCATLKHLCIALFLVAFVGILLGTPLLLQLSCSRSTLRHILYLTQKYRLHIIGTMVAIIGILHTIYPFVKKLDPSPAGVRRSLLQKRYINISNSFLLSSSWAILILSIFSIILQMYFGLALFFIITILIAFLLCHRYIFLSSTSKLNKKLEEFEQNLRTLRYEQLPLWKAQAIVAKTLTGQVFLYFNFLENKNPRYNMAAILKRNHVFMSPNVLIVFMYFGISYYSCADLSVKSLAKNCDDFSRACAEIFNSNTRKNLHICSSISRLSEKLIQELCKYFDIHYLNVKNHTNNIQADLEHLAQTHLLTAPANKVVAKIHHYL